MTGWQPWKEAWVDYGYVLLSIIGVLIVLLVMVTRVWRRRNRGEG